jgi:hypothetical protein
LKRPGVFIQKIHILQFFLFKLTQMKKLLLLSTLAITLCAVDSIAQTAPSSKVYGTNFKQETVMAPARLSYLLKDKDKLENAQLGGYVSEVCQKEGCWLRLRTDKNSKDDVFVKIKDHAFLLPKDIAGRMAIVNGTVTKKVQTVAEQQHYLEDAGASKEEIAKITQPKEVYQMQVTGVLLFD